MQNKSFNCKLMRTVLVYVVNKVPLEGALVLPFVLKAANSRTKLQYYVQKLQTVILVLH